jgi:hypothetical protein
MGSKLDIFPNFYKVCVRYYDLIYNKDMDLYAIMTIYIYIYIYILANFNDDNC